MHHNFLHLMHNIESEVGQDKISSEFCRLQKLMEGNQILKGLFPEQLANYRNGVRINSPIYNVDLQ